MPAALAALARAVVDRLPGLTIAAITGSAGKTTTKDLAAQLIERLGPTVSPRNSYNNEIGHPLTVLRVTRETRYLVAEMSARGPGHIAALCEISPPQLGAVLCVGLAHAGMFGSIDDVAAAKAELPEALPADGVAVLNADDPRVLAMAGRTRARVVTFGQSRRGGRPRGRHHARRGRPGPLHPGHRGGAGPGPAAAARRAQRDQRAGGRGAGRPARHGDIRGRGRAVGGSCPEQVADGSNRAQGRCDRRQRRLQR